MKAMNIGKIQDQMGSLLEDGAEFFYPLIILIISLLPFVWLFLEKLAGAI